MLGRKFLEPDTTTLGHLKMINRNIRSTKPKEKQVPIIDELLDDEPLPTPTKPRDTIHDVGVYIVDPHEATTRPELKNLIASDLLGR